VDDRAQGDSTRVGGHIRRDLFGHDNPFKAHLKEAPPASAIEYPTDAIFSPPSTYSAEYVPELVINEEHMINPITGSLGCWWSFYRFSIL
jgi:hypothetical protein